MEDQCQCPFCNRKFVASPALRGKKVKCKQCSGIFVVPETPGSQPIPQPTPQKVAQPVSQLTPNLTGVASAVPQCPWCLSALPPGTTECPQCRAQQQSPLSRPSMAGSASKKREANRAVWIIGAGAGIMASRSSSYW